MSVSVSVRVLSRCQSAGVLPDASIWASVMGACQRAGEGRRVLELRQIMDQAGVAPSSAVYSHVIAACVANRQFNHALQVQHFQTTKSPPH